MQIATQQGLSPSIQPESNSTKSLDPIFVDEARVLLDRHGSDLVAGIISGLVKAGIFTGQLDSSQPLTAETLACFLNPPGGATDTYIIIKSPQPNYYDVEIISVFGPTMSSGKIFPMAVRGDRIEVTGEPRVCRRP